MFSSSSSSSSSPDSSAAAAATTTTTAKRLGAKRCRVCGDDQSVFYNYDGLSCKSCKKFFLRNAFKAEGLRCRDADSPDRAGKCRLDKVYRRYCKLCRIQRCQAIGMRKELISFAKRRQDQQQLQKENRQFSSSAPTISSITSSSITSSITSSSITSSITSSSITSSSSSSFSGSNPFELSDYELQWIATVQRATSVFVIAPQYKVVGEPQTIVEAINIGEMFSRKYVQFCKGLPQFKSFGTEEQLLLLKAAFPEISSVNIAFLYDPQEGGFPVVVNEEGTKAYFIRAGLQPKFKKKKDIGAVWSRFINSMHTELEGDIVIRDLIYAQLLFKERANVVHSLEVIRYQHNIYCHILKRYLQKKYANEVTAEMKYSSIMYLLGQIDDASNTIRSVFKRIDDTSKIVQVLAELYNLV